MEIKKGLCLAVLAFGANIEAARTPLNGNTVDQREEKKSDQEQKKSEKDNKKRHKMHSNKESKSSSKSSIKDSVVVKTKVRHPENVVEGTDITHRRRSSRDVVDTGDYSRKLYYEVDFGMIKYSLFKNNFVGAAGLPIQFNDNYRNSSTAGLIGTTSLDSTITLAHAAIVPLIRGGIGAEFRDINCSWGKNGKTNARIGIDVSYAKLRDAVRTYFTNAGQETPNLIGKQTISRGELMLSGSYDLWQDLFSLQGGVGVVGGALKELRLYQQVGALLADTGQYLKPYSANVGGFVGAALAHRFEKMDRLRFEIAYRAVFSAVKYHTTVYQDIPNPAVSSQYRNAWAALAQYGVTAELPVQPSLVICAHELTLGVVIEF